MTARIVPSEMSPVRAADASRSLRCSSFAAGPRLATNSDTVEPSTMFSFLPAHRSTDSGSSGDARSPARQIEHHLALVPGKSHRARCHQAAQPPVKNKSDSSQSPSDPLLPFTRRSHTEQDERLHLGGLPPLDPFGRSPSPRKSSRAAEDRPVRSSAHVFAAPPACGIGCSVPWTDLLQRTRPTPDSAQLGVEPRFKESPGREGGVQPPAQCAQSASENSANASCETGSAANLRTRPIVPVGHGPRVLLA